MALEINKRVVKDRLIMCRFDPDTFSKIEKLAREYKCSRGEVVRAFVKSGLKRVKA